jgi:hypothetical protein
VKRVVLDIHFEPITYWCGCYAIIPDRYVILSNFRYAVVTWFKFTLEQATNAQRGSGGVALFFL